MLERVAFHCLWRGKRLSQNNDKELNSLENLQGMFQMLKVEMLMLVHELEKRVHSK